MIQKRKFEDKLVFMTDNSTISMIAIKEGKNADNDDLTEIMEEIEDMYKN